MATFQACERIGMPGTLSLLFAVYRSQCSRSPECRINLAHLVSYLAEAPKSTRSYKAYARAELLAKQDMTLPVPHAVRNAPTELMQELGYGEEYRYNPDYREVPDHLLIFIACETKTYNIDIRYTISAFPWK